MVFLSDIIVFTSMAKEYCSNPYNPTFFLSYTHERPKGSRLQIFLAFSSDQTVNFESIDALMQASPLADYYKIAPIEDVPVCLRKSFTNILLVKNKNKHVFPQEIRYLQSKAGNPIPSHVFMKWKNRRGS